MLDLARTRNPAGKATAFLAVPTVSALAWIAFFIAVYGAPDPAIPYRGSDLGAPAYIPGGLGGLFFDQMYGLFSNAPVLLAAPAGMVVLALRRGPYRLLSAQLAFIALPYVLTVTHFAMWWGGFSSPARFLVPLLPVLAIPVAVACAATAQRTLRAVLAGALVADRLHRDAARGSRPRPAGLLRSRQRLCAVDWTGRAGRADLAHGLPAYFARVQRQRAGRLFFSRLPCGWRPLPSRAWRCAQLERRWQPHSGDTPTPLATVVTVAGATIAAAVMVAIAVVWKIEKVDGRTPAAAAMNLLRGVGAADRLAAIDLTNRARGCSAPDAACGRMELRLTRAPRTGGPPREDRALFLLPQVPAGEYRCGRSGRGGRRLADGRRRRRPRSVRARHRAGRGLRPGGGGALSGRRSGAGRAGRRGRAARRCGRCTCGRCRLRSRDDKVAGRAGAPRGALRPRDRRSSWTSAASPSRAASGWVVRATRAVVLQPDTPRGSLTLQLRNAPVDNVVTVREPGLERNAAPGARRGAPHRRAARRCRRRRAGDLRFLGRLPAGRCRRSSRDTRFLGAWVRVE